MRVELTDEELQELGTFAGLMFSDKELAEIMEIPAARLKAELMVDDSPVRKTITAARYRVEASLRKAQIEMALRGSQPAANTCNDLLTKMRS